MIDDLGFDARRTERTARLPGPLTLAFLPYAKGAPAQARAARARGHELFVHMPMEPIGAENPGPGALRLADSPAQIRDKLARAIAAIDGAAGLNNHMGSRITRAAAPMAVVAETLKARGMTFLDSRTAPDAVAAETAQAAGVAWAARDVFLDDDPSPAAVRRQLDRAEAVARRAGRAVAIGHPYDSTLAALEAFLPQAQARGIVLAPMSEIARRNRLADVARALVAQVK